MEFLQIYKRLHVGKKNYIILHDLRDGKRNYSFKLQQSLKLGLEY